MYIWNYIYIDGKGFKELDGRIDRWIVLETAKLLNDIRNEFVRYAESSIHIASLTGYQLPTFQMSLQIIIRKALMGA